MFINAWHVNIARSRPTCIRASRQSMQAQLLEPAEWDWREGRERWKDAGVVMLPSRQRRDYASCPVSADPLRPCGRRSPRAVGPSAGRDVVGRGHRPRRPHHRIPRQMISSSRPRPRVQLQQPRHQQSVRLGGILTLRGHSLGGDGARLVHAGWSYITCRLPPLPLLLLLLLPMRHVLADYPPSRWITV